jgi:hypothetical protein
MPRRGSAARISGSLGLIGSGSWKLIAAGSLRRCINKALDVRIVRSAGRRRVAAHGEIGTAEQCGSGVAAIHD